MDSNRNLNIESVATGRYKKEKKIGTWKEFMNDRLLSKENIKKQLPCD
jgi:hypothetical protein